MNKYELNLEIILDNMRSLIETYASKQDRTNISELLDIQDELATMSYTLAECVADCKESYLTSFFEQKIAVNSAQRALMSQKFDGKKPTLGESKANAELMNKELIKSTMKDEALAYKAKMTLESCYKVLDGIRQRISHLKQEYDLANRSTSA